MAFYPPDELTPIAHEDRSAVPGSLKLFAQIERLVGEERRLLAESSEHLRHEQRERLRAVSEELDRIWETLSERARRGPRKPSEQPR